MERDSDSVEFLHEIAGERLVGVNICWGRLWRSGPESRPGGTGARDLRPGKSPSPLQGPAGMIIFI